MDLSMEPSLDIKKWHVADVDGTKVALLGYIASNTAGITSSGAVTFSDPVCFCLLHTGTSLAALFLSCGTSLYLLNKVTVSLL